MLSAMDWNDCPRSIGIPVRNRRNPQKTIHPCQFPVELVERLVLALTDRGDSVFDPYMGVGSAIVAALMHDRTAYGCDVVKKYVDVAWERVHALRAGSLKTRAMNKPVYDPSLPYGGHRQ